MSTIEKYNKALEDYEAASHSLELALQHYASLGFARHDPVVHAGTDIQGQVVAIAKQNLVDLAFMKDCSTR